MCWVDRCSIHGISRQVKEEGSVGMRTTGTLVCPFPNIIALESLSFFNCTQVCMGKIREVGATQQAALHGVDLREEANTAPSPGSARRRAPQRSGRSGPKAKKDEARLQGPQGGPATPRP